jgi:CRISPR system Cascade subunit CasD
MAFGGETIDNLGVIRDFPAQSMLTGLIANALGWRREDSAAHDRLQARLKFGARLDRAGICFTDFQTAELHKDDRGWTTHGKPEGRGGGDGTYKGQHLRYRDYHADAAVLVALRLTPVDEPPTLDTLADALKLFAGWYEAPDILTVLREAPPLTAQAHTASTRMQWPADEGVLKGSRQLDLCDERNWTSGVHGGWRPVCEGVLPQEDRA